MSKHLKINETAAGAGNSRAMEADTILKTRESSKIQKSRCNLKIFLVLLAVVLSAGYAQAQFSIGARAGLSYSTYYSGSYDGHKESTNYLNIPGYQLGVTAEYAINKSLAIQPSLLFGQQRAKEKWYRDGYYNDDEIYDCYFKYNFNFLQVPINLQYNLHLNGAIVYLQAGPYFGYMLGGKQKEQYWEWNYNNNYKIKQTEKKVIFKETPENYDWETSQEVYTDTKPFDLGIGMGIGLRASNFQLGFNYNLGLNNVVFDDRDGKLKGKRDGFSFSLSYFFSKKNKEI